MSFSSGSPKWLRFPLGWVAFEVGWWLVDFLDRHLGCPTTLEKAPSCKSYLSPRVRLVVELPINAVDEGPALQGPLLLLALPPKLLARTRAAWLPTDSGNGAEAV